MDETILMVETYIEESHAAALTERLSGRRLVRLPSPSGDALRAAWTAGSTTTTPRWTVVGVEPALHAGRLVVRWRGRARAHPPAASRGPAVEYVGMLDSIRPWLRPLRWRDAVPYHLTEAVLISDPDARRAYLVQSGQDDGPPSTPPGPGPAEGLPVAAQPGHRSQAGEADRSPRAFHPQELSELRRRPGRLPGEPVRDRRLDRALRSATPACAGPPTSAPDTRRSRWPADHEACGRGRRSDTLVAALERDLERAAREREAAARVAAVTRCTAPPPA